MGSKKGENLENSSSERPLEGSAKAALANLDASEEENNIETNSTTKEVDLGVVPSEADKKTAQDAENKAKFSKIGWRQIKLENLPSEGKYYIKGLRLDIRPARAEEIKHYSSLVESDIINIDEHLNDIITSCSRIVDTEGEGRQLKSGVIKEADKYYIFFSIRDLTMKNMQKSHKLSQKAKCQKCGQTCTREITNQTFSSYEIKSGIDKHYDEDERCFVINDKSFSQPLKIYIPSIGVIQAIKQFIVTKERDKRAGKDSFYDRDFMTKIQFLVPDAADVNDKTVEKLTERFSAVSKSTIEETNALNYLVENIKIGADPYLIFTCDDAPKREGGCSDEYSFTTPIRFQGGFRSLFDFSNIISGLFGDSE